MLEPTILPLFVVLSVGTEVYVTREFRIFHHAEDDLASISVVNLVFFLHPRRRVVGKVALVAEGEAFPVDSP